MEEASYLRVGALHSGKVGERAEARQDDAMAVLEAEYLPSAFAESFEERLPCWLHCTDPRWWCNER